MDNKVTKDSLLSFVIELDHLRHNLRSAYKFLMDYFERISRNIQVIINEKPDEEYEKNRAMIIILIEYVILNLAKLIEIRKSILPKILHEEGFDRLYTILKDSWQSFLDEEKITKIRDKMIAHSGDQAYSYVSLEEIDSDFPESYKDFILAAGLAEYYTSLILHHLGEDIFQEARIYREREIKVGDIKISDWFNKIENKKREIIRMTNLKLEDNGLDQLILG